MAPSKGKGSVQDEVDEMFAGTEGGADTASDGDFDDLLDSVEEDDSEGWVPTEKGEGIAGTLVKIGETRSDFAKDDDDPMCPTWTIQVRPTPEQVAAGKPGDKFRVIGYGAVLKREMQDSNAEVGWRVAVKYFGEKPIKRGRFAGKLYKHYGVVARPPQSGWGTAG